MFLFNLQPILIGIAVFSIPALLLELQLMVIGLLKPVIITPTYLIVTAVIGIVSLIGALLIEIKEG